MGIASYLRRKIVAPLERKLDFQSAIIFDAHLRELLSSAPYSDPKRLEPHGFRSYSQNDEDGIIQEICSRIGLQSGTFVEFGVQDGRQNNSLLLLYKGWKGLWLEADPHDCAVMQRRFDMQVAAGQLQIKNSFVTKENINALIATARLADVDLLSIDIDGNDYWIWDAVEIKPAVLVIEYNAKFRPPVRWIMDYDPNHRWDGSDHHGASLQSLAELGRRKGYTLVGCCLAGVNAFFVRDDLVENRFIHADPSELYNPPRYYLQYFLQAGHPPR